MKQFSQLGIKPPEIKHFVGTKLKKGQIINKKIAVHDYKIENSKLQGKEGTKCLTLQIEIAGNKHVWFTGSTYLIDAIKQIGPDEFPFETVVIEEDQRLQFT